MSLTRDFGRRESIQTIPEMDSVLSGHGRKAGPTDVRYVTFTFRVFTTGDLDAAYDLLAAQIAPGDPQRLVYQTDSGALWFTLGYNPSIKHTLAAANHMGRLAYADFSVTWRIRPDWRPRYSEASDIWGVNDGVWGTSDGNWGASFTIALTTDPTTWYVDARGTAGSNLPTMPDRAPRITIDGVAGGATGLRIVNSTQTNYDTLGTAWSEYFDIPKVPAGQQAVLDFAAQRFTLNGTPIRPTKPAWQREYMLIKPGVLNAFSAQCLGGAAEMAGAILIDWWRKRA